MGDFKAILTLLLTVLSLISAQKIRDLDVARQFLDEYNESAMKIVYRAKEAGWNYQTNITDENQRKSVSATN